MSYSEILIELASRNDLSQGTIQKIDHDFLNSIFKEVPNKEILLNQLLFSLDQIFELIKLTLEHHELTGMHLGRVGRLGAMLAQKAGLHWKERLECLYGGWIHDIGKIYVPTEILDKPEKLTHEEYELIKLHVNFGCDVLKYYPHLEPFLSPLRFHHEHFDGKGYPYKISGTDIPIAARIICIVDAYDAMTGFRPYLNTKTHEQAIEEIKRCAGSHFDPKLANLFCSLSKHEIERIQAQLRY